MPENDPLREIIDGVFEKDVVSHYLMIAEVITERGQHLRLVVSEEMTPWLAMGLLSAAESMVLNPEETLEGEEDE